MSRPQPLVALLYRVPLLCEALSSVLDDIGHVQAFPASRGDPVGLLRSIRPDAVVVDDRDEAESARRWAKRHHVALVHVAVREQTIDILRNGRWEQRPGATVESIRNALAESLFGRGDEAR